MECGGSVERDMPSGSESSIVQNVYYFFLPYFSCVRSNFFPCVSQMMTNVQQDESCDIRCPGVMLSSALTTCY